MKKDLILATRAEVKIEGDKRSIQLFDEHGNKVAGKNARWEGDFYCRNNQLTSLEGAPKEVGGYFYCDNNQLTSLEGAPKEVGGDFYCRNNQLTSLEGAPKEVGGYFSCRNNQLTSLEGAPIENKREACCNRIFKLKLKKGYILADRILAKLVRRKKLIALNLYVVRIIGKKEISFIAHKKVSENENVFAHGSSASDAINELNFKLNARDKSKSSFFYLRNDLDQEIKLDDAILAYRVITGACKLGINAFVESATIPEKITPNLILKLTENMYGNKKFREFLEET